MSKHRPFSSNVIRNYIFLPTLVFLATFGAATFFAPAAALEAAGFAAAAFLAAGFAAFFSSPPSVAGAASAAASAAGVVIIGGADGPTAIFVSYNAQELWGLCVKVFSNVVVVVLNYVFSKLIIFKKK